MSEAKPLRRPSPCWMSTAVAGKVWLGVEVASTMRSMSSACSPAFCRAARAAASPSEAVVSSVAAIWRWRMPVRCTIHSSEVSTTPSKSVFFMMRRGSAEPIPRTTDQITPEPLLPELLRGIRRRDSLDGLACQRRLARMEAVEIGLDARQKLVAHHVVAELDGRRKAFVVGAAMAFYDDAVEAEEHAAITLA